MEAHQDHRRSTFHGWSRTEENCFDALPDSVLFLIFGKVRDLRSLILCSLVSKRFGLLIPQTDSIRIHLDYFEKLGRHTKRGYGNLLRNLFRGHCIKLIGTRPQTSIPGGDRPSPYSALHLLQSRFQKVRYLHIELKNSGNKLDGEESSSRLMKWRAVFGSHLETCVILLASSLYRTDEGDRARAKFSAKPELSHSDLRWIVELAKCCVVNASFRLVYYAPGDKHGTLQRVVVSDDSRRGRLCMGRDEMSSFRTSCSGADGDSTEKMRLRRLESVAGPLLLSVWYMPVLDLPQSGYEMSRAIVVVVRRGGNGPIAMEREVRSLLGAFDDEEKGKIYDEAVMAIGKCKRKKIYTSRVRSFAEK
ncbi:hypothetical protein CDL15_Pgr025340 [Punica granatum]|uniref:F-box domain-containing protein n=1 Tax=Punica granatum TaxID=22663 RepID=A0A218W9C7_PUNGR|nr:hypothetical protein CDL15_Pgr025340 [Punica granatum]